MSEVIATIMPSDDKNEREMVALVIDETARQIRSGLCVGFDLRWQKGSGVLSGTKVIQPPLTADSITIEAKVGG